VLVRSFLDEPEDDGTEQDGGGKFHGTFLADDAYARLRGRRAFWMLRCGKSLIQ
jgi:hypothetical protein